MQDQKELTEKECRKLIVTAIAEGKEQLALCIETIACTGIRISEIKYFTVERVKVGKIEIYYKVTKDITGLADLLGHSSINVTRIYTATTETVFQKKLDKIVEQEILECTT